jgi:hypothetical protein
VHKQLRSFGTRPRNLWHADLDARLDPIIDALTGDEERRRETVGCLLRVAIPPVQARVTDRLIDVLRTGSQAGRRGAADSLAEIGEAAAPALQHALLTSRRRPAFCIRLVELLVRIGRALPPARRFPIQIDLGITQALTQHVELAAAIEWAFRELHPGIAAGTPGNDPAR